MLTHSGATFSQTQYLKLEAKLLLKRNINSKQHLNLTIICDYTCKHFLFRPGSI